MGMVIFLVFVLQMHKYGKKVHGIQIQLLLGIEYERNNEMLLMYDPSYLRR